MRKTIKGWMRFLARNRFTWAVLNPTFLRVARSIDAERRLLLAGEPAVDVQQAIHQLYPDLTVRHGPFRGLRYPQARSTGSLLAPKLIGCYERELHSTIEKLLARPFQVVVDIGCAEGFYAVGLARRLPEAAVHAFDTSPEAQELCLAMAEINQVADRVHISGVCIPETLMGLLDPSRPALIICDCEGYEKQLFTPELVEKLRPHVLIIETHDLYDLSITTVLRSRFSSTHHLEMISSLDDIQKVHHYQYPELASYSLEARLLLLSEYRQHIMEWMVLTPR
ncbi:MAG TPA: methyltransferase [Gemmatales bacterium]|nr:methyltransferase [Gemmatales bacterium]